MSVSTTRKTAAAAGGVMLASAMALAAVQPSPADMASAPHREVESLAVNLAASIDPITPWVDAFTLATDNISTLVEFYLQKPFPLLQTVVANLGTYATELENGQGDLIPEQIWNNVQTFFTAPWDPGKQVTLPQVDVGTELTAPFPACTAPSSCSSTEQPKGNSSQDTWYLFWNVVGGISQENPLTNEGFPALTVWNALVDYQQVLNFAFTPYSGQVLGWLGPAISPVIQLTRSFTAVGQYFQDGDITGAINELINIPANTTNAFLNGAGFWDLTPVVEAVIGGPLPVVDPYITPDLKLGLNLGGLLNAVPKNGSLTSPENPPTEWFGIGFDGLSLRDSPDAFFGENANIIYAYPNGLGGAAIALGQYLSDQLLVTPPPPPTTAAAAPAESAETVDAPAPAPAAAVAESAPVVEEAPAADDIAAVVDEDPAPVAVAIDEEPATESAAAALKSAPAAAGAAGDDSGGNTGRAARHGGRGAD